MTNTFLPSPVNVQKYHPEKGSKPEKAVENVLLHKSGKLSQLHEHSLESHDDDGRKTCLEEKKRKHSCRGFPTANSGKRTFGSGSNKGPTKSRTMMSRPTEIKLVSCVFPPTLTCTRVLPIEAAEGGQEKKEPNTLAAPCSRAWITFQTLSLTNLISSYVSKHFL